MDRAGKRLDYMRRDVLQPGINTVCPDLGIQKTKIKI